MLRAHLVTIFLKIAAGETILVESWCQSIACYSIISDALLYLLLSEGRDDLIKWGILTLCRKKINFSWYWQHKSNLKNSFLLMLRSFIISICAIKFWMNKVYKIRKNMRTTFRVLLSYIHANERFRDYKLTISLAIFLLRFKYNDCI